MEAGKLIVKTVLDSSDFEDGLDDLEKDSKLKAVLNKITSKFSSIFSKVGQGAGKIGKTITQIGSLLIKTLGKAVTSAVGLGLAFGTAFAVITAIALILTAVAGALKKVFEENQQLKTDIQYIIFAIKTALEPVINAITNVIAKIISWIIEGYKYIMAIANILAGRNLFNKATPKAFADSMKEASKSAKSTAKSAKEINKQLAGFDEMNILGKNTTASGGGGGGTDINLTPSFDATNLSEIEAKIKAVVDRIKNYFSMDITAGLKWQFIGLGDTATGVFKMIGGVASGNFDMILEGAGQTVKGIGEGFAGLVLTIQTAWDMIIQLGVKAGTKVREFILNNVINPINKKLEFTGFTIQEILTLPTTLGKRVAEKITKKIDEIKNKLKDNFKDGFWKGIGNTLIDIMNSAIDRINDKLKLKVGSTLASVLGAIGVKVQAGTYQLFSIPKIPKLAKGGIVNMPGRGVPVGGARAGERGAEGVIPLTDSQQMALLGEAIGRYITINANITNTMNGRIISRELQKIQNENNFANNL